MPQPATSRRVVAFLVTEDWYFVSHRLPMARAARAAGYEIHVLANIGGHGAAIEAEGFHLHPLRWRRGSLNPLSVLSIIGQVRAIYRELRPNLAHHVALQPSIIGSLAALGLPVTCVNALAGLGYGFTSRRIKARLIRPVLAALLRLVLNRPRAFALVQNPDDRDVVCGLGVRADKIFLIPGSGVDTEKLTPLPEPAGPVTAAFVGRLLDDKGLRSLIGACKLLTARGRGIRLLIAGEADPANPASIPQAEIESWRQVDGVTLLGHADVREVWRQAHIAVLPSRREGMPLSLLEAAACGRPIVATDVSGCREVARDGLNAILVPPDDPVALADAIDRLASDPALRRQYGIAGRQLVEQNFSSAIIGKEIVTLYDKLVAHSS